jgi:very-short-patch-repair endonuclease
LRFTNNEVLSDLKKVLDIIKEKIIESTS